jgi:WD40 repeat protein
MKPSDDAAVCTLRNCQFYTLSLDADSSKGEDVKCTRLFQENHHDQIVGMDTCSKKPIVVTCGADRSVRIWNYLENTLEVSKVFDDDPQR